MERLLPIMMIALSIGAAVIYAMQHDYKRAIYWVLAAAITATVTH